MRALFNRWRRRVVNVWLYRRVFGEQSQGRWLPHARISPACCIEGESHLVLHDHVYIGPFCWIEASGGVTLEEGVQITSHVSIVTHSSHRTLRLMGRAYAGDGTAEAAGTGARGATDASGGSSAAAAADARRPGWVAGAVHIGAFSFIGPHVVIEAGSVLGKGCIVRAGSVVRGRFGDHAVLQGQPARVVGDARTTDELLLAAHPQWRRAYEAWAGTGSR